MYMHVFGNDKRSPNCRRDCVLQGIIFSIIAGAAMSIQGVMNTRLSDRIGIYETNALVQGIAFVS